MFYLRGLRLSGFPPTKAEMTALEFNLLIYTNTVVETFEWRSKAAQKELLEANIELTQNFLQAMFTQG